MSARGTKPKYIELESAPMKKTQVAAGLVLHLNGNCTLAWYKQALERLSVDWLLRYGSPSHRRRRE